MYTRGEREQAPKSSKQMLIAAGAGLAIAGVATVGYVKSQDNQSFQNLSATVPSELAESFFLEVADPCNDWYHGASTTFIGGLDNFIPQAKFMYEYGPLLTRYGRDEYHTAMGNMINEIDELISAQRDLGTVYAYSNKWMEKTHKFATDQSKSYKFMFNYSRKVAQNCFTEEEKIMKKMRTLNSKETSSRNSFAQLEKVFSGRAKKDYDAWSCETMYPYPVKFEVDWLQVISEAVQQGFEIYNEVRGLIPAGSEQAEALGLSEGIPALPDGLEEKVGTGFKIFEQARDVFSAFTGDSSGEMEEFANFEEFLELQSVNMGGQTRQLTELQSFGGGESDAQFQERIELWNSYIAKCKAAKMEFARGIGEVQAQLTGLSNTDSVKKTILRIDDNLASTVLDYNEAATAYIKTGVNDYPGAEFSKISAMADATWAAYQQAALDMETNKGECNISKAMLLQLGQ